MQKNGWKKHWQNIRPGSQEYDRGIKVVVVNRIILIKMKAIKISAAIILISCVIISGCSNSRRIKVEPPLDSAAVKNMIDSRDFIFIPRHVNPLGGGRRDLTPGFELSVSKDTIVSYLPYFGRGYTAPVSPTDVDFDFRSKKFTYAVTPARKGWNISIKIQDQPYLRELYFRIFNNASASLTISGIDRSSISYDGYISARRPKEESDK